MSVTASVDRLFAEDARLNRPSSELPASCEVLVVGAGPAGSAAAIVLARAGLDVVLVDQHAFPRDKVCGDGLIPDAHQALRRLGVFEAVMARARAVSHVTAIGPRGGRVQVPGALAVLPRRQLDALLCRAAVDAGARMHAPLRFLGPIESTAASGARRVAGARLQAGDEVHELRADSVVLATGAVPQALLAAGLCRRRTPSAIALRAYLHHPALCARVDSLEVVWHPRLRGGYGWVFPCGDGVFNVGVGLEQPPREAGRPAGKRAAARGNLREMLRVFGEVHPPAGELLGAGRWLGEVKGAPLRCSLAGAALTRPGLLVAGEAAGTTYAFTGEGIGKALETGILAGESLVAARRDRLDDEVLRQRYEAGVLALAPRYAVYDRARVVNHRPWLVDLLVWSARRSPSRLRRMSGILEETYLPSDLLSPKSVMRALFAHG
jgi:geranylgeranyl reductase family protein